MRRIAVINQKGGVGKTTTCVNLGAALARQGRRVVLIDMDAQANLTISLNVEAPPESPSTYTVLLGSTTIEESLRPTATPGLRILPSNIDLSGAELELAGAMGREHLMRDALRDFEAAHRQRHGEAPADYVIFDCPPSLGLLSVNALSAAREVLVAIQTEFLALQGMSKLMEVLQILRRRLNPELEVAGILPCLYDSRLKLAREVLAEVRAYFPDKVLPTPIRANVKLAEAPSFGQTIFEYAPDSNGAQDYLALARELMRAETGAAAPSTAVSPTAVPPPAQPAASAREPEDLATFVITPPGPPAARAAPIEPPVDELPPLPADAFEILESYVYER